MSEDHASVAVVPLKPFAVSPKEAARLENCGLTTVYERLNSGEYQAVKDGTRTKILVSSIEARRASLPPAEFKPYSVRADHKRRAGSTRPRTRRPKGAR